MCGCSFTVIDRNSKVSSTLEATHNPTYRTVRLALSRSSGSLRDWLGRPRLPFLCMRAPHSARSRLWILI